MSSLCSAARRRLQFPGRSSPARNIALCIALWPTSIERGSFVLMLEAGFTSLNALAGHPTLHALGALIVLMAGAGAIWKGALAKKAAPEFRTQPLYAWKRYWPK